MSKGKQEDPVEGLRNRRNRLAEKLVRRIGRAKRHEVEQDLGHLRQLNEVLALADGIPREPLSAPKRLPLLVGAVLLGAATLFLMWKRTSIGAVQIDVWSTCIGGTLRSDAASELEFGVEAKSVTVNQLAAVDTLGVRLPGSSLQLRSPSSSGLRLSSVQAPPGCGLELDLTVTGRLRITLQPAGEEDTVLARFSAQPGVSVHFDEDGRLARELEGTPISAVLVCEGAAGKPVTIVLDSEAWTSRTEALSGLSGIELAGLSFAAPFNAAAEGPVRFKSAVVEGQCLVEHTGVEAILIPRAGVLIAEEWDGFVAALELAERGLHLQWYGQAKELRAGHPNDPKELLPVLFQRWVGHSPRAYFGLVLAYASLIPIMGILRMLLGRSNFNPALDMEEPL